ncbi:50S ribosomal protein L17 [Candidatus Peribacteria bacterium]|nr:50S ribosomal protein L17 [Candidatus Peribacteria bacterium]
MRHRKSTLRLNYKPQLARMMERNLVTSLLLYESIRTTQKRAKVIQPIIDKLITAARTKTPVLAIRHINAVVTDRNASRKIMEVYKARYAKRTSGLTRIVPVGARKGDGARLVDLTMMDSDVTVEKQEKAGRAEKRVSSSKK